MLFILRDLGGRGKDLGGVTKSLLLVHMMMGIYAGYGDKVREVRALLQAKKQATLSAQSHCRVL